VGAGTGGSGGDVGGGAPGGSGGGVGGTGGSGDAGGSAGGSAAGVGGTGCTAVDICRSSSRSGTPFAFGCMPHLIFVPYPCNLVTFEHVLRHCSGLVGICTVGLEFTTGRYFAGAGLLAGNAALISPLF
jgi:hypothetical protein